MHVDWRSRRGHYDERPPPSTVHGWLTKLRGIFSFNRRLIRHGNDEILDAHALREYERDRRRRHRSRRGSREGGIFSGMFGRRRYEEDVLGDQGRRRHKRHHPFMHFRHRCRPWYHGDHHRLWGFLTRRHSLMDLGRQKREHARHERERERRRRLRRLRDEGLAIRLGASHIEEIPRSSSSRRPRHHRHHGGPRTEVLVSN